MLRRIRGVTSGVVAGAIVAAWCVVPAEAADWVPTEHVVLVSHSSPGTGNDLLLRELADIWTKDKLVPQLVSVENVTGGRSERARRFVSQQNRGNPHMLLAFTPASLNQAILAKSQYTYRSFTPIALLAIDPYLLVVNSSSPYHSLKDLISAAREKPKSVLQGGGSYGNSASMAGRMIQETANVEFSYTPFKGGGAAVVALLGNHVQFIIENPAEVEQHVRAGKMRALAASIRLSQFPDVPTFSEAGVAFKPLKQFRAVMAPPGIPPAAAKYYVTLLEKTRATPRWKDYLAKNALIENWITGAALTQFFEDEERVYRKLDEQMGLFKKKKKKK